MAKGKGDATLGKLSKNLVSINSELQTIQRSIQLMREAGKSAKQIYEAYGKQLEKLIEDESKLNDEIEDRKELVKNESATLEKYNALQRKSTRERKAALAQLSDIELKEYKKSENVKNSGLKADKQRKKAALKANDNLELQKVRSSRLSTNKRLEAELNILNKIQRRYKKSSKEYKDAETAKVKAQADALRKRDSLIKKYRSSRPKEQTDSGGGFAANLRKGFSGSELGRGIGRITGVASAVQFFRSVLNQLRKALVDSFTAAVEFEAQLAQLQAVTGINNDELARLEKNVLNVAGSTKFTSEQIVQLQTELGKLGFSVSEIEGATLAVAETAQALGEQVGPVAQKIGQILNQYNLTAAETVNVSDTLVSVINSSALSFESFGTALQYVGPLGAEVGTSFRETSTAMAILADNGFTASRIGTGLRGILTELSTTGKDLTTVIKELAEEEISLGEAVDLVGKRNAAQLITLIENSEVLEDLEGKYYNVGSAAIASAQQIDTYAGNLDLLKSAFNRVQIEFGNFLKVSGLLRASLKLLDKQGYETALAMEFLANIDPEGFSEGLGDAAENAVKLAEASGQFADREAIYAKEATKLFKDSLTPLQLEYIENQERIAEIDAMDLIAKGRAKDLGEEKVFELRKERLALIEANRENSEYAITSEERLATEKEITRQIERQAEQLVLFNARNDIEEEYKESLEGLQERRDKENMTLREGLFLRADINSKEKELRDIRTAQQTAVEKSEATLKSLRDTNEPKEVIEIAERELEISRARLEQYDQEITNLTNVNLSKEELFALAQKEYELEFARLRNSITERRKQLKTDQEILNLQIKTRQNEIDTLAIRIKNTKDSEEKLELEKQQKALIEQQTEAEGERATLQKKANEDVQGYLADVSTKLEDQKALWKAAGFDPNSLRILEKASERLEQMNIAVADLAVDFPEALDAADNLAKSLQDRFADKLKDGGMLSEADLKEINDSIAKNFAQYNLTPEQMEALSGYILSTLKPGDKSKKDLEKELDKALKIVFDNVGEVAEEYNKTALENTKNRLDSELEAIKNRYKVEGDILKSQLDNQLITESQFRAKQKELRQKQLADENDINKKIFEAEKKADINNVIIETSESLASNILQNYGNADSATASIYTILGTAAIVAAGAAKADAINRRKFFPVKYEEGGIVNGPSHAQGGVPFTVQGQGGYEMEGGEFIVNKKASAMHRGLLEKINNSYKTPTLPSSYKFASGGMVPNVANESVDYLKAIAEATTSTAISASKPVRAFVSSKDLRANENERRLRDRNDKI
jgi:hypothetical protein